MLTELLFSIGIYSYFLELSDVEAELYLLLIGKSKKFIIFKIF